MTKKQLSFSQMLATMVMASKPTLAGDTLHQQGICTSKPTLAEDTLGKIGWAGKRLQAAGVTQSKKLFLAILAAVGAPAHQIREYVQGSGTQDTIGGKWEQTAQSSQAWCSATALTWLIVRCSAIPTDSAAAPAHSPATAAHLSRGPASSSQI